MIILRQKTFNSKSMKALRNAVDTSIGKNWHKEASKYFKPNIIGDGSVNNLKSWGRSLQKTPVTDIKTLNGRINRKGMFENRLNLRRKNPTIPSEQRELLDYIDKDNIKLTNLRKTDWL